MDMHTKEGVILWLVPIVEVVMMEAAACSYVDDFTYFWASGEVEKAFKYLLDQEVQVEFMCDVAWFLGSYYTLTTDSRRQTCYCILHHPNCQSQNPSRRTQDGQL
jgi:hypothetical protein